MKEEVNIEKEMMFELKHQFGLPEDQIEQFIKAAKHLASEGYLYDITKAAPAIVNQFHVSGIDPALLLGTL
jgi:hypothetical protein